MSAWRVFMFQMLTLPSLQPRTITSAFQQMEVTVPRPVSAGILVPSLMVLPSTVKWYS